MESVPGGGKDKLTDFIKCQVQQEYLLEPTFSGFLLAHVSLYCCIVSTLLWCAF